MAIPVPSARTGEAAGAAPVPLQQQPDKPKAFKMPSTELFPPWTSAGRTEPLDLRRWFQGVARVCKGHHLSESDWRTAAALLMPSGAHKEWIHRYIDEASSGGPYEPPVDVKTYTFNETVLNACQGEYQALSNATNRAIFLVRLLEEAGFKQQGPNHGPLRRQQECCKYGRSAPHDKKEQAHRLLIQFSQETGGRKDVQDRMGPHASATSRRHHQGGLPLCHHLGRSHPLPSDWTHAAGGPARLQGALIELATWSFDAHQFPGEGEGYIVLIKNQSGPP
jgi:hypothetical protein